MCTSRAVILADEIIDEMEVEIEEDCLKMLALHQPVAIDLRYVVAVLKMNTELERIGDYAENISKRAESFKSEPRFDLPEMFWDMAQGTQSMLARVLDALINFNADAARDVCKADNRIDELNGQVYDFVKTELQGGSIYVSSLIHLLTVSRMMERTADRVTNIAEDIIYMIDGSIIRHHEEG